MEIVIRIIGKEDIFLEVCFIKIAINSYTVIVNPPFESLDTMEEVEEKKFADRDYRFLFISPNIIRKLEKYKCSIRVLAEDDEGRTIYSNNIEFK